MSEAWYHRFMAQHERNATRRKWPGWRLAGYALVALIIITPIRLFVAQPFYVSGDSMEPDFAPADYLIIDELSYRIHAPARGDVIVFRYPLDPDKVFIKRIVGLPGETVQIAGGKITIAGENLVGIMTLDDPFAATTSTPAMSTTLHSDEYYVMGDNRLASSDSRVWGPVARRFIIGRAFVRLFPILRFSIMPGKNSLAREDIHTIFTSQ